MVQLLESIGNKLIDIEHLESFMSMILAGLAGNSSLMKSDAIVTLGVLMEKFYDRLSTPFVVELTQVVLLMIREKNNEVFKAVIGYLKGMAKAHKKNHLTSLPGMKEILHDLLELDVDAREKNIIVLKRLIMSFIRSYGISVV